MRPEDLSTAAPSIRSTTAISPLHAPRAMRCDARVFLLPAADPPHKGPTHADAQQRARMLDLAVAGEPGLKVDRRELRREGPSYTIDTLLELRAELGDECPDRLAGRRRFARRTAYLAALARIVRSRAHPGGAATGIPYRRGHAGARSRRRSMPRRRSAGAPWRNCRGAGRRSRACCPCKNCARNRRLSCAVASPRATAPGGDWVPPSVAGYIDRHHLYSTAGPTSASL